MVNEPTKRRLTKHLEVAKVYLPVAINRASTQITRSLKRRRRSLQKLLQQNAPEKILEHARQRISQVKSEPDKALACEYATEILIELSKREKAKTKIKDL